MIPLEFKKKGNQMKIKAALKIVIELAEQNILEEEFAKNSDILEKERKKETNSCLYGNQRLVV